MNIQNIQILTTKISLVEGEEWIVQQRAFAENSVEGAFQDWEKFLNWKATLTSKQIEQFSNNDYHSTLNNLGMGGVIYGFLGFSRYFVLTNGEVIFSVSHGKARIKLAQNVGFKIY